MKKPKYISVNGRVYRRVESSGLSRTAALRPTDKKVLKSFYEKRPAEGYLLSTDGKTLDKMGMGGGEFARWVDEDYVEATRTLAVRSDDMILRALKKVIPKHWLIL